MIVVVLEGENSSTFAIDLIRSDMMWIIWWILKFSHVETFAQLAATSSIVYTHCIYILFEFSTRRKFPLFKQKESFAFSVWVFSDVGSFGCVRSFHRQWVEKVWTFSFSWKLQQVANRLKTECWIPASRADEKLFSLFFRCERVKHLQCLDREIEMVWSVKLWWNSEFPLKFSPTCNLCRFTWFNVIRSFFARENSNLPHLIVHFEPRWIGVNYHDNIQIKMPAEKLDCYWTYNNSRHDVVCIFHWNFAYLLRLASTRHWTLHAQQILCVCIEFAATKESQLRPMTESRSFSCHTKKKS